MNFTAEISHDFVARKRTESVAEGVHLVKTRQGLARIQDPTCAAAIWQRPMDTRLQDWINELDPDMLPQARIILKPEDMRATVHEICDESGTPNGPERNLFVDDVVRLAEIFAELMSAPYLQLRFDVTTTNACKKFHTDYLTARLVCTYRGPGTQYGKSIEGQDPELVCSVPAGAPILMRGKHWPPKPDPQLLHRSPPIEGTGETRLLLVFDPVSEPSDERDLG